MTIQEQIAWLRDISHHSMAIDCQREADTMEKLLAVYEAAQKIEPLLRGDPLIDGIVQWQEDIDLRKAINAVKDHE